MHAHLVVGWDGSTSARRALAWALTQPLESLLLVQVVDGLDRFGGLGTSADPRAEGAVSVETAAADAGLAHPHLAVDVRVVTGDPVEQLALASGPDVLVVVGDRRRRILPLRGGWSIGARLAARADGPVAIIARDTPEGGTGVLVGIDDSDDARAALAFAAGWAARTGQTLHVVHAWRTPFLWNDRGTPPAALLDEVQAQHAEVLADAVAQARRLEPGLTVEGVEVDAPAGRALLDAAPGRALLVVGDGGVSHLEKLLIGSVSHDVLVDLSIPTVVVGRRAVAAALPDAPPAGPVLPTRTVVAWDGGRPSRSAVEWAMARERSGDLDVVMIADEGASSPGSTFAASTVALDERALSRMLAQVSASAPDIALHGRVVRGYVLHALAALTRPDTLLVVGTEDREGPRLRFGLSVGARLVALAQGAVAIIPRTVDTSLSGVAVGVDGSRSSHEAVLVAAAEAARRGETLHLVHAWVQPTLYERSFLLDAEFLAALEQEHRSLLDDARAHAEAAAPGTPVETHLVVGSPAHVLASLEPRAAVIVIGTRRLSGWRRLLLGSVGHELILHLDVPVIVVGHPASRGHDDARVAQAATRTTSPAVSAGSPA